MIRGLVAGLGLISVLGALIIVALLMVNSMAGSLAGGGSEGDGPSTGGADSVVLRISGTPGVKFSGNYTTARGSQPLSGTLGSAPMDYDLGGQGVAGVNVLTANVQKQGKSGTLKAEVLKNGQVVQSRETNAASNSVNVTYSP